MIFTAIVKIIAPFIISDDIQDKSILPSVLLTPPKLVIPEGGMPAVNATLPLFAFVQVELCTP